MDFAALQHSVFLQALGSAILNSLWQCFILWLLYETISASYKSASARFKNNLGTLLLFCSFGWFLITLIFKIFNQQNVTSIAAIPASFALESQQGAHAVLDLRALLTYASASLPYFSVAYIFLLFLLMSRLVAAYRYVYFISTKRLLNPTRELQLFASKVSREIGITKKISVWISHHIDVPATIGFIKPVILIPLASINNLSCHQLEAIILHELAHIKRNDYITNLIISVIETVLFFNPFVVLLANSIKRERENCCDDFVLQYRYDPHSYASALLRLEQSRMGSLKLAIGAVSGKKQLLSRIKRITSSQVVSRQFNYGQRMVALLLVTAFICSVAWLTPEEKKSVSIKALSKKIKAVPLLKTKSINTIQPPLEVIAADKQIENLPAINMDHVSPKNEPVILPETNVENNPQKRSHEEDVDKNDNMDLFKVENNFEYPEAVNVKQPLFFLNETNIKLPPSINIQNFPFQDMNFNIDLGKIDMAKMNENLKQVYKQINDVDWNKVQVDWNKVQNEIRKCIPKMKPGNAPKKEQDAFFKVLSKISLLHAQHQFNLQAMKDQVKNEMLRDSSVAEEMMNWNDNNIKVQHAFKKTQQQDEGNTSDNYYFNYSNNTDCDNDEEVKRACIQSNSAPSNPSKKTMKVSIKRIRNHTGVLYEKKPLQFSFYNNDDEKPNHQDLIRVEVTDLP
jgi:beta-lactamase regulating signal transducer with metallopeptidase domain